MVHAAIIHGMNLLQNESTSNVAEMSKISDNNVHHLSFPAKLHAMLARPDIADVISWMPHGRAWRVHKPKAFERKVIPMFFVQCKYSSFIRQANGWGFRRITKGLDRNAYYHKSFLRGCPDLCKKMRRPATSAKVPLNKGESEPDFYKLSEIDPLPEVCPPNKIALMNNLVVPEFRLKPNPGNKTEVFPKKNLSLPIVVEKQSLTKNELECDKRLNPFQTPNALPQPYNRHELLPFQAPLCFHEKSAEITYNKMVLSNLLLKERLSAGIPYSQTQFPMLQPQVCPDRIRYPPSNLNVVGADAISQRHPLETRNYLHEIEALNRSAQNHAARMNLQASNTSELVGRATNALSLNIMQNPILNIREANETNNLKTKVGRLLAAFSTHESKSTRY